MGQPKLLICYFKLQVASNVNVISDMRLESYSIYRIIILQITYTYERTITENVMNTDTPQFRWQVSVLLFVFQIEHIFSNFFPISCEKNPKKGRAIFFYLNIIQQDTNTSKAKECKKIIFILLIRRKIKISPLSSEKFRRKYFLQLLRKGKHFSLTAAAATFSA